jgi:cobalt/nickel transport system ATP-binding protein
VGDVPVTKSTLGDIRKTVGMVFQDPDDQLFMASVRDDVAFGPGNLGLRGVELEARVDEALSAVGMSHVADRAPHHLSLGQRRRVAVATVLAMRPEILVLDEPTSNMDPAGRRELVELLRSLDVTLLVLTHDLPFALEVCERSLVMADGRIVADGPTLDLLADDEGLRRYRLEMPLGFDAGAASRRLALRDDR